MDGEKEPYTPDEAMKEASEIRDIADRLDQSTGESGERTVLSSAYKEAEKIVDTKARIIEVAFFENFFDSEKGLIIVSHERREELEKEYREEYKLKFEDPLYIYGFIHNHPELITFQNEEGQRQELRAPYEFFGPRKVSLEEVEEREKRTLSSGRLDQRIQYAREEFLKQQAIAEQIPAKLRTSLEDYYTWLVNPSGALLDGDHRTGTIRKETYDELKGAIADPEKIVLTGGIAVGGYESKKGFNSEQKYTLSRYWAIANNPEKK